MKRGLYKTSSGIYKNLQRILLCIVFSVLSFIFSRLTFQNTFYALPLCTLAALSVSIFAPNAAWGAVTVSAAVITLILLEQTFNTDNSSRAKGSNVVINLLGSFRYMLDCYSMPQEH